MAAVTLSLSRISFKLDDLHSVALGDLAKMNAEEQGMHEAFPNLSFGKRGQDERA
jgi:hypothetical protein